MMGWRTRADHKEQSHDDGKSWFSDRKESGMEQNAFQVEFGLQEYPGWVSVKIWSGDAALQFDSSYIGDPFPGLITAVIQVLQGQPQASVTWSDEREVYDFLFSTHAEETTLQVWRYPEGGYWTREADGELIFKVSADRVGMVLAFWRALGQLQATDGFARRWMHDFPSGPFESLSMGVRALKGLLGHPTT
jgi:hypothetical protein